MVCVITIGYASNVTDLAAVNIVNSNSTARLFAIVRIHISRIVLHRDSANDAFASEATNLDSGRARRWLRFIDHRHDHPLAVHGRPCFSVYKIIRSIPRRRDHFHAEYAFFRRRRYKIHLHLPLRRRHTACRRLGTLSSVVRTRTRRQLALGMHR